MERVRFSLQDGRGSLEMDFGEFAAKFSTENVDALIAKLGEQRALMTPRVEQQPPPGEILAPENPMWVVANTEAHTMLRIRDPRFGWLRYGFTAEHRQAMARALSTKEGGHPETLAGRPRGDVSCVVDHRDPQTTAHAERPVRRPRDVSPEG